MHSRKHRAISMFIARVHYPIRTARIPSRSQLPSKTERNTTSEHSAKNKLTRCTKALKFSARQEDTIPEIKASSALPKQCSSGRVACLIPSSQRSMLVRVGKKRVLICISSWIDVGASRSTSAQHQSQEEVAAHDITVFARYPTTAPSQIRSHHSSMPKQMNIDELESDLLPWTDVVAVHLPVLSISRR